MKRSINSKIQINPVLKIGKGPMDNIYLYLFGKIQVKYGISRWIDKFPEMIFRHMWMLFKEAPTDNNGIIKNYTNYLEIYKSVFNLTASTIKQLQTESKQQLPLALNLPDNIQWNKNVYLRLKQENSRKVNGLHGKNPSVNEPYGISADTQKEWPNIGRTIILNSLNNVNLLQHTLVNTFKTIVNRVEPNLEVFVSRPLRKASAESVKVHMDLPQHMELQRKLVSEKRADNQHEKVNHKIGQTVGVDIHYHKNPNNDMGASEGILPKANTTESPSIHNQALQQQRNYKEGYSSLQVPLKKNVSLEALRQGSSLINPLKLILKVKYRNILNSERGVIHRNHEFFSKTNKKKVYTKVAVKVQEKDAIKVLGHATREAMKVYKDNGLTYLTVSKKETRDSSAQQLKEMPPTEKEAHSRTFTEPKGNRNFKDIEEAEINLLADRVFKVIEKRIEIRKDRRGLR